MVTKIFLYFKVILNVIGLKNKNRQILENFQKVKNILKMDKKKMSKIKKFFQI